MSTLPIQGPKARWFDSDGAPLGGGKLFSYAAGTSTPQNTFTTRAGTIANANPVILDANGEADIWLTPGVLYKFVLKDSSDVIQWTVDNFPGGSDSASSTDNSSAIDPGGRLTLTSATPCTVSDVTGATTIYYTPHLHTKVPLYDGTNWSLNTISELSQATSDNTKSPAAVVANSNYDLFIWNDSGTIRLSRGPLWSSSTTRGTGAGTTELESVDSRYVNKNAISNGPAARRGLYVGSIRSDGSSHLTDARGFRHVWNRYHQIKRSMNVIEASTGWTYQTDAWRQANGSALNQLDFLLGLSEEPVSATVLAMAVAITAVSDPSVGIGLDSTTVNSATLQMGVDSVPVNVYATLVATYEAFPGLGRHTLVWLERANQGGGGTTGWAGTQTVGAPSPITTAGIQGYLFA